MFEEFVDVDNSSIYSLEVKAVQGYNIYHIEEYLKLDEGYLVYVESTETDLALVSRQTYDSDKLLSDYYYDYSTNKYEMLNSILNFRITADYPLYYFGKIFDLQTAKLGDITIRFSLNNTISVVDFVIRIYPGKKNEF